MGFFADFHNKGVFKKSLNATFISLIPKVAVADDIKPFRPISLVGSVYKILAKVFASRLRKVVEKLWVRCSMLSQPSNLGCCLDC